MISISDYIEYFRNLAESHNEIQHTEGTPHFARLEIDEMIMQIPSSICFPYMALESYDLGINEDGDTLLQEHTGAFSILDRCANLDDYTRIHEIYESTEAIAKDVLSRVRYDRDNNHSIVKSFDFSSVRFQFVGPLAENTYGVRVTFQIFSHHSFTYDATRWNFNDE